MPARAMRPRHSAARPGFSGRAEKPFLMRRFAVASCPVDKDRSESNGSTRISRTRTDVSLRTLRRERLARRHVLEQIEGDGLLEQVALDKDEMVIGRAAGADIRLTSKKASRHHVFLRQRGTDCVMVDNDSENGVLLNGVQVHSAVLRDGDVIHVADSVFVYREE